MRAKSLQLPENTPDPDHFMDLARLQAAYHTARADLLAARGAHGHWEGRLASSSLSTATAISALAIVRRETNDAELQPLMDAGVKYLAGQQNDDGGFGDTDKSHSNIATTYLVIAALHLARRETEYAELLSRAWKYIESKGGIAGLKQRYGVDKTFVVPIMTNLALAGLCGWKEISPLPFELACIPQSWYRFAQMPVVSYAIPALVAIGQAHYFHRKPWNPYSRIVRGLSVEPSLRVLLRMQPNSGGYLEATPLTSFVVMSLAATGRANHAVTQAGVRFIKDSLRDDGSWPIDTNLATWVTSLSLNALGPDETEIDDRCWTWLLDCQHLQRHPFTGADPFGWGWTDLSGAVPDADDTPGALLALWMRLPQPSRVLNEGRIVMTAAFRGIGWLLKLQNRDGGWPTFCRGWGRLPFDRSGTDLTAHAIRALCAWLPQYKTFAEVFATPHSNREVTAILRAMERGFAYLAKKQNPDGSWSPLWFGNQDHPAEDNPIYGTAKVLLAYLDTARMSDPAAVRGLHWLASSQNAEGSFGGSVEETALALEGLMSCPEREKYAAAVDRGLAWLVERVERGEHRNSSPIGFYFAKLWYYEELYPLIFTVSTLRVAVTTLLHPPDATPPA